MSPVFIAGAALLLLGCRDELPTEPAPPAPSPPVALSGIWDFTETLIISAAVLVCRDTGTFNFRQDGKAFAGSGGLIGTCDGVLGTIRNAATFALDSGIVTDSAISFSIPGGCRYIGTVTSDQPRRIIGSSACSINFDGSWEAVEARPVGSIDVQPDSLGMVVGETVRLTPILHDTFGARVFERPVSWTTSGSIALVAAENGLATGTSTGPGTVAVTATVAGKRSRVRLSSEFVSFESMDAGIFHACASSTDGLAYCWGRNDRGQSGPSVGTIPCESRAPCRTVPAVVSRDLQFATVSTGFDSSCGITGTGDAYCWGANSVGQLGNNSMTSSATPVPVSLSSVFTSVSVGSEHVCGLADAGAAFCWGSNATGQLGIGATERSDVPVPVSGNPSFVELVSGGIHTCGLRADGTVSCWGDNFGGQLGVDISTRRSFEPVDAVAGFTFSSISAGALHMCGLSSDSSGLYCWGENTDRQLGEDSLTFSHTPVRPPGGQDFVSVSSGGFHTCALTVDGSAHCWGRGSSGQLGGGSVTGDVPTPMPVVGGHRFRALSAGAFYTCGITVGGKLYCWGSNIDGELGAGLSSTRAEPVLVVGQS